MKYQNATFSVYPSRTYSENFDKIFDSVGPAPDPVACKFCKQMPQRYKAEGTWHVACYAHEPKIINEYTAAIESDAVEQWNNANE